MFVILPTGFGKSTFYACFPNIFDRHACLLQESILQKLWNTILISDVITVIVYTSA